MKFTSLILPAAIVIIACIWMATGLFKESGDTQNAAQETVETAQNSKKLFSVQTRVSKAQSFTNTLSVTGRSNPSKSVEIQSQTSGEVSSIAVEEGAFVNKGTVLARLNVNEREASQREAEQNLEEKKTAYEAAEALAARGFSSDVRVKQTRAALEAARAALKLATLELSHTLIVAPFSGVVNQQNIEAGDYVALGEPVFEFVALDPIEFTVYLSENSVAGVALNDTVEIDLLNKGTIEGKVTFIAADADPNTRTFRTVIRADNPDHDIRGGMTAEIKIPLTERQAHFIVPSILALNDAGQVGVNTVDDSNVVRFVPVEILKSETRGMWVSGLPETARVITVGGNFVAPGQTVNPSDVSADPASPSPVSG